MEKNVWKWWILRESLVAEGSRHKIDHHRKMATLCGFNTNYLWGNWANLLGILRTPFGKKIRSNNVTTKMLKKAEFSKHKSLASQNWFQNLSLISINFNKVVLKCILCLQCLYSYVFEVELIWCQTNVIHSSARPSILSWKETW